jgi:WD40 repeat protein
MADAPISKHSDAPFNFISYARADDEPFVKRLYADLTEQCIGVWWDREAMNNRGRTFLQEIRDAVARADRVIAVIGPRALESEYVRVEWEHALLFSKAVVPILRLGNYGELPADFAHLHSPDFRESRPYPEALSELVRILKEPVPPLPPFLTEVPSLPPHFLPRRDDLKRLEEFVLADIQRPTAGKQVTALQGMGGSGKSVLAAAFARATNTRRAFTDGIVWLKAGLDLDPLPNLKLVGLAFDDLQEHPESYVNPEAARARLPQILADKACLIILDDVWDILQATPFRNSLGPRCRLLITTRERSLATALEAQECRVEVFSGEAALALLAEWSGGLVGDLPPEAHDVATECGNLPLALAQCGATAREGVSWADLREALREADLSFIEKQLPDYSHTGVLKSFKVSMDVLERADPKGAQRYQELVVFPAGTAVPEAAVMTLWLDGGGLTERHARKLLATLEGKALLRLEGREPLRLIRLHDLQSDYLRAVQGDLTTLHRRLLSAYAARSTGGWPTGPNDGYFFQRLSYHLQAAGREEELRHLLLNFYWLRAKLAAVDVANLLADYEQALTATRPGDPLSLIHEALRLSAHVLATDSDQLAGHLLGRLSSSADAGIQTLLAEAGGARRGVAWLRPLRASLTTPGGPLLRTLAGRGDFLIAVAVTPDGRFAVAATSQLLSDSELQVWDIVEGRVVRTLGEHGGEITGVAVTSDGRLAISSERGSRPALFFREARDISQDHVLRVFEIESGRELHVLRGHTAAVNAVAATPDGRLAVSASSDSTLIVWDISTGKALRTLSGHTDAVNDVAIAPGARLVISAGADRTLLVWDIDSGQVVGTLVGHTAAVTAVGVTPDGRLAVSASEDKTLQLWNPAAGKAIGTLRGHTDPINDIAITPDGRLAVSAAGQAVYSEDNTVKVWDVAGGRLLQTFSGHCHAVQAVAVMPDGRSLISASLDGTLKIWDLTEKRDTLTTRHEDDVNDMAVTPDGRFAVSASNDKTLKVWDVVSGAVVHTLVGHTASVEKVAVTSDGRTAVSAGGNYLRAGGRQLMVWDIGTGQAIHTLGGHDDEYIRAVAVTPDCRLAISAADDRRLKVWDIQRGEEVRVLAGHEGWVYSVAVTPDSRFVISAAEDNTLRVWELDSGATIHTLSGHTDSVNEVAVTPDGRLIISASTDTTLKVWEFASGKELYTLTGHKSIINGVAISRDGRFAVSYSGDGTLIVWDISTGKMVSTFTEHTAVIYSIALTPDCRFVVFASVDETLKVWDMAGQRLVATFRGEGGFNTCAVAADSRTIVAGDRSGGVHILRLELPEDVAVDGVKL